jgi:hypothetical protein
MAFMKLGRKPVAVDAAAHTPGIKQGNSRGNYEKQAGFLPDGTSTAERSTGVDPQARNPIDPRMPGLFPG